MKVKQLLAGTLAAAMIVTSLPAANIGSVSAKAAEMEVVDDEMDEAFDSENAAIPTFMTVTDTMVDNAEAELPESKYYEVNASSMNVPSEDIDFYKNMGAFTVTVTGTIGQETNYAQALFTLKSSDNKDYMTVWLCPTNGYVCYAYCQDGVSSIPGLMWVSSSVKHYAANDFFKVSVSFVKSSDQETYSIVCTGNGSRGSAGLTATYSEIKNFLNGSRKIDEAVIGKPAVTTHGMHNNVGGQQIKDFQGTIETVTVYRHENDADALDSLNAKPMSVYVEELETLIQECETIDGTYTNESFQAFTNTFEDAKSLNANAATDWDIREKRNALTAAKKALVPANPDDIKPALIEELKDQIAKVSSYISLEGTYTNLDKLQEAITAAQNLDTDTASASVISRHIAALKSSLKSVSKVYLSQGNISTADSKEFFEALQGLAITTVIKYDESFQSQKVYPLVTLSGTNNGQPAYISLYMNVNKYSDGSQIVLDYSTGNSSLAFKINGSYINPNDGYRKLTVAFDGPGGLMHLAMDAVHGSTINQTAVAGSKWFSEPMELLKTMSITNVIIGQHSISNHTVSENEFPGIIKYVSISGLSDEVYSFDETSHTNTSLSTTINEVTENLETQYKELLSKQNAYITETWEAYNSAYIVYQNATTEWAKWDALDAVTTAYENLTLKTLSGIDILNNGSSISDTTLKMTKNCQLDDNSITLDVVPAPEGVIASADEFDITITGDDGVVSCSFGSSSTPEPGEDIEMDELSDSEAGTVGDLEETESIRLQIEPLKTGSAHIEIRHKEFANVSASFDVEVKTIGRIIYQEEGNPTPREVTFVYSTIESENRNIPTDSLDLPEKPGFAASTEVTVEDVLQQIYDGILEICIPVTYEKVYHISIEGANGTIDGTEERFVDVPYLASVKVLADLETDEGQFVGWKDLDTGKYVSYATIYTLIAWKDIRLEAVYEEVPARPIQFHVSGTAAGTGVEVDNREKIKYTITANRTVPVELLKKGDRQLIAHGILITKDDRYATADKSAWGTLSAENLTPGDKIAKSQATATKGLVGTYVVNVKTVNPTVYARAYVIYKDKDGNTTLEISDEMETITYNE